MKIRHVAMSISLRGRGAIDVERVGQKQVTPSKIYRTWEVLLDCSSMVIGPARIAGMSTGPEEVRVTSAVLQSQTAKMSHVWGAAAVTLTCKTPRTGSGTTPMTKILMSSGEGSGSIRTVLAPDRQERQRHAMALFRIPLPLRRRQQEEEEVQLWLVVARLILHSIPLEKEEDPQRMIVQTRAETAVVGPLRLGPL